MHHWITLAILDLHRFQCHVCKNYFLEVLNEKYQRPQLLGELRSMLARDFYNYSVATVFTDLGTLRTGFSFSACTELVREYLSLEYTHLNLALQMYTCSDSKLFVVIHCLHK